jgi:anti-anti-sigma regulatory factor
MRLGNASRCAPIGRGRSVRHIMATSSMSREWSVGAVLAEYTVLVVDLEGERPVSAAVLAALMHAQRRLALRDGRLLLTTEHAAVCNALERAGLELMDA